MLRVVALGACLLGVLSGCSSPASDDSLTTSPTALTTSSSAAAAPTTPVLTDTLHLLDPPHMAATLNPRGEPFRNPVPSATDALGAVFGASPTLAWTLPETNLTAFAGVATVWVDVQGFVTHQGATQPCFWFLAFRLDRQDGGFYLQSAGCVEEPMVVPEGVRAIEFVFDGVDFSAPTFNGTVLSLQLYTAALASAPGASVSALSGGLEHDSRVTVVGLQIPLDTQTLLI